MATGLIVGMGEVGIALEVVLKSYHDIHTYDAKDPRRQDEFFATLKGDVDVLHICFPYSDQFGASVQSYQEHVQPRYTVIHSTVPVGTSKALECYHSPVRGIHPHLAESMRKFYTYLAPDDITLVGYFLDAGFRIRLAETTDDTEAGKLWSLVSYAVSIILEKQIYEYCENNSLDFGVIYKDFTETYNDGYARMGVNNIQRPVLEHMEGAIGGHCVIPGVEELADSGSELAQIILELNK